MLVGFSSIFVANTKTIFCFLFSSFFKLRFTPCKAEQPLKDMELQEKEAQKD